MTLQRTAEKPTHTHYWQSCAAHGKVLFLTEAAALAAIDRMLGQRVPEARWLNAYPCDRGRGFHVGRVMLP